MLLVTLLLLSYIPVAMIFYALGALRELEVMSKILRIMADYG